MTRREASLMTKPCPFCGADAAVGYWHGGGTQKTIIHCTNDDCSVAPGVTGSTPSIALDKWNTRAA